MKTIKIHAIHARAERLNQPEMVEIYEDMSEVWDTVNGVCIMTDENHSTVNELWNETLIATGAPRGCTKCRGLR